MARIINQMRALIENWQALKPGLKNVAETFEESLQP